MEETWKLKNDGGILEQIVNTNCIGPNYNVCLIEGWRDCISWIEIEKERKEDFDCGRKN